MVRHKFCGARLFDTRLDLEEVPLSVADIFIKCRKCHKLVGFRIRRGTEDGE